MDGAGELRAFWSIMLPLAHPGLITVGIFAFLGTWNEFFMAFMFLSGDGSQELRTLPLGLANITIVSQYRSDWGMAFAGLVLMVLPVCDSTAASDERDYGRRIKRVVMQHL